MAYRHCDTFKADILTFIVQVDNELLSSKMKETVLSYLTHTML